MKMIKCLIKKEVIVFILAIWIIIIIFVINKLNAPCLIHMTVNVVDFGAKGDGITDDTQAIQDVLNKYDTIIIPEGTYLIDTKIGLRPLSNQIIRIDPNANLMAIHKPNPSDDAHLFRIKLVENVSISGGSLVGDRYKLDNVSGGWGMGIYIGKGARKINISHMTIMDFWGDAIYIGGGSHNQDIIIKDVIGDNNGRQGLTITNGTNIVVEGCFFQNTNGRLPEAGIDIEPNDGEVCKNIIISNTLVKNNNGTGITGWGKKGVVKNLSIIDCMFVDNGNDLFMMGIQSLKMDIDNQQLYIFYEGNYIIFNEKSGYPFFTEGKWMVPFRKLVESFDAKIIWDHDNNTVILYRNERIMEIPIDKNSITGEKQHKKDIDLIECEGKLFLSIRSIEKLFKCTLKWDKDSNIMNIQQK